jgi:hypothetical protein
MAFKRREQHQAALAQSARAFVPAGKLGGGGGLAASGVGVQQRHGLRVEGAVEGQQSFVAAHKAHVGRRGQERGGGAGVRSQCETDAVCFAKTASVFEERQGRGLVHHRHLPILQGNALEGDFALGLGVQ